MSHADAIHDALRNTMLAIADEPNLHPDVAQAVNEALRANSVEAAVLAAARAAVLAKFAARSAGVVHGITEAAFKHAMRESGWGELKTETPDRKITVTEGKEGRRLVLLDSTKLTDPSLWKDPEPDMVAVERAWEAGKLPEGAVRWEIVPPQIRITTTLKKKRSETE